MLFLNNQKIKKYLYGWKLYVNYGQGWEYEIFEETYKGYKENARLYRENCQWPTRWTYGRMINDEYLTAIMLLQPTNELEYQ